ncbi:MAG: hypothetical protein GTO46_11555 [Gemmatimonadetes bacterium]|nr:hypothetical protein [Gemmatimonadota bacterium]NIO32230.1 hypothetical protein [Gemmatimonadota bacterium]
MRAPVLLIVLLALSVALPAVALGQEADDTVQAPDEALRVFLDCRSRYCDFDHFRREIAFVNYVRDRTDSDVHVLVTTRRTGSGGDEFTIEFIGQDDFDTVDDRLIYFSSDTDVEYEVRDGLTRTLKLGLVRYVARLPMAERFDVTYEAPDTLEAAPTAQVQDDPWNFWILRVRIGGNFGGEERLSLYATNGSFSANRTTEDWKIRLHASGWYSEDNFEFSDGSETKSVSRNYSTGVFAVKSLSDHWSLGGTAEARVSTFRNHDLAIEIGPALEYNIFPYSESTRRALTFAVAALYNYFDYEEITIFDKTTERRPAGVLEIEYSVRQPFGTINMGFAAFSYLDNLKQHSFDLGGRLNIRLVRGLELNLNGSVQRIKDQIHLARGGATDEEVLLRRRELGTDWRYRLGFSLSYTFGSIYNNVVNPRFD